MTGMNAIHSLFPLKDGCHLIFNLALTEGLLSRSWPFTVFHMPALMLFGLEHVFGDYFFYLYFLSISLVEFLGGNKDDVNGINPFN